MKPRALSLIGLVTACLLAGAANADATPKKYVAFGDSYASGDYLAPYRDANCKRSFQNYPSKVASTLGYAAGADFEDFTCNGARSDMTRGSLSSWGGLEDQVKTWAVNQNVFDASTVLVTITIGGNDYWRSVQPEAGTGSPYAVVDLCGRANWPCENDTSFVKPAEITAQGFTNRVYPSVQKIHALAPNAKILIVGYPGIVPRPAPAPNQITCNNNNYFGWSYGPNAELAYQHSILSALKSAQDASTTQMENALEAANGQPATVNYVDTYSPSDLHDLCRPNASDRWVDRPGSATPLHPTVAGMDAFASRVVTSYTTQN